MLAPRSSIAQSSIGFQPGSRRSGLNSVCSWRLRAPGQARCLCYLASARSSVAQSSIGFQPVSRGSDLDSVCSWWLRAPGQARCLCYVAGGPIERCPKYHRLPACLSWRGLRFRMQLAVTRLRTGKMPMLVRHGALITAGESPALLNRERTRSTE
jgi:hypothetical protein